MITMVEIRARLSLTMDLFHPLWPHPFLAALPFSLCNALATIFVIDLFHPLWPHPFLTALPFSLCNALAAIFII